MTRHEVTAAVLGSGTGDTSYVGSCSSCSWRFEHVSASRVLDAIGAHELGLS